MYKNEVICLAQEYCNVSYTETSDANGWYNGWSGVSKLTQTHYLETTRRGGERGKARYRLTPKGWNMAKTLIIHEFGQNRLNPRPTIASNNNNNNNSNNFSNASFSLEDFSSDSSDNSNANDIFIDNINENNTNINNNNNDNFEDELARAIQESLRQEYLTPKAKNNGINGKNEEKIESNAKTKSKSKNGNSNGKPQVYVPPLPSLSKRKINPTGKNASKQNQNNTQIRNSSILGKFSL